MDERQIRFDQVKRKTESQKIKIKNTRVVGVDLCVNPERGVKQNSSYIQDRHIGLSLRRNGVSQIIQWLKTMTTNEYIRNVKQHNWKPFDQKIWQRNYYDRIILCRWFSVSDLNLVFLKTFL